MKNTCSSPRDVLASEDMVDDDSATKKFLELCRLLDAQREAALLDPELRERLRLEQIQRDREREEFKRWIREQREKFIQEGGDPSQFE